MGLRQIVVIGAGGFGREVVDVIDDINRIEPTYEVVGLLDDSPSEVDLGRLSHRNLRYLGTVNGYLGAGVRAEFVIGIASPNARRLIDERMVAAGHTATVLVHPTATVGSMVTLGPGVVLCAGARLTTNITLGRHTHVNLNATIGHDSVLEPYTTLNPASAVSGNCVIHEGASLGVGSAVLQGLTVGSGAFVGAAALVTKDVPAGSVVKGVPAR